MLLSTFAPSAALRAPAVARAAVTDAADPGCRAKLFVAGFILGHPGRLALAPASADAASLLFPD